MNGFIFINEDGKYAVEHEYTGFGSRSMTISFVKSLNSATLFRSETIAKRKYAELKNCVSIKAVETRNVKLNEWTN